VDSAIQAIAVEIEPVRINGRRRGGVARVGAVVDFAAAGAILEAPDGRAGVLVQGDDVPVLSCDEKQVLAVARGLNLEQEGGRAVRHTGQGNLEELLQGADVAGANLSLQRGVAAMLRIEAELRPVSLDKIKRRPLGCHSERSEESPGRHKEMLRSAQHDTGRLWKSPGHTRP